MKKLITSLALAMLLVAVMVVPAMAANPDDTVIDGDVGSTIDITAPGDFSLGSMPAGQTTTSGVQNGMVYANAAWSMTAQDEKGTNTGYMVSGGTPLLNEMEISDDGSTWCDASGATTQLVYSGSATGSAGASFDFYAQQYVSYDDVVATNYTITITFTGSIP